MAYRSSRRYAKRRVYRRRTIRRPKRTTRRIPRGVRRLTSRRRILNFTSRKKQDNMEPYVIPSPNIGTGVGTVGPVTMQVSTGLRAYMFIPTARALDRDGTTKDEPQARTQSLTYARGYKEHSRFNLAGTSAWLWRRICFTLKGLDLIDLPQFTTSGTPGGNVVFAYTTNGYVRPITNLTDASTAAAWPVVYSYIFRGAVNQDWNDIMTAKVDTNRITLKMDRTVTMNPTVSGGKMLDKRDWHPMNKNLVYFDDESNIGVQDQYYSTFGRQGMGDYYILDLFQPSAGGTSTDTLTWQPQGTYYWHEK